MSGDETYRAFIAIELPGDLRRRIKEHVDRLRAAYAEVRASWSREDNLHLTLKFLGDVPVSRVPDLSEACRKSARQLAPFDLVISGCGTFPPHGKPKVLWLGIENAAAEQRSSAVSPEHPLLLLHAAIEDHCAAAGFARESRAYHPHLTIARIREARHTRALSERHKQIGFAPLSFTVTELILFRSELSSRGSKHTPLARHTLE